MGAKGAGCEDVNWIHVAQLRVLVDSVISNGFYKRQGISKVAERLLASLIRNMLYGII